MTSISSDGSSIITLQFGHLNIDVAEQEVQAAINAAQTYLPTDLPTPPIYSKSNPADAPILTLALTSMPAPPQSRISPTHGWPKKSPRSGRRSGQHQRRAKTGRAHPGQSHGTFILRHQPGIPAHGAPAIQHQPSQGQFRRPAQSYQIDANDQFLTSKDYRPVCRLSKRRPGGSFRRGQRDRWRRKHQTSRMDEQARQSSSTSSANPARISSRSWTASNSCSRNSRATCRRRWTFLFDRPHHHHPRLGARR